MKRRGLNLDFDHLDSLFDARPQARRIAVKPDETGNPPTTLNSQQIYTWSVTVWAWPTFIGHNTPFKGCGFRFLQPVIAIENDYQIEIPDVPVFDVIGIVLSQRSGESPFHLVNQETLLRYSEKARPQDLFFISHSTVDNRFARHLDNYLTSKYETFIDDRDVRLGNQRDPTLLRGLNKSDYLMLILSPDAMASEWVEWEWKWWLSNKEPSTLIPVMFQEVPLPDELRQVIYIRYEGDIASVASQIVHAIGDTVVDIFD